MKSLCYFFKVSGKSDSSFQLSSLHIHYKIKINKLLVFLFRAISHLGTIFSEINTPLFLQNYCFLQGFFSEEVP